MGKVCHDCTVIPSKTGPKNGESLMRRQNMTQGKERPKVTVLNEIPGVIQSNAGPSIKGSSTSVFLRSTQGKTRVKEELSECQRKICWIYCSGYLKSMSIGQ